MASATSYSEGVVVFPSIPSSSFRYKVTADSSAVAFCLEDCKSKKQWCEDVSLSLSVLVYYMNLTENIYVISRRKSGKTKISGFDNANNSIEDAFLADYVSVSMYSLWTGCCECRFFADSSTACMNRYAQCFVACLKSDVSAEELSGYRCDLRQPAGYSDICTLEFTVELTTFNSV